MKKDRNLTLWLQVQYETSINDMCAHSLMLSQENKKRSERKKAAIAANTIIKKKNS